MPSAPAGVGLVHKGSAIETWLHSRSAKSTAKIAEKLAIIGERKSLMQVGSRRASAAPVTAVLDTNTVLALWWFEDPAVAALRAAIEAERLPCLACRPMLDELAHVLARGLLPARRRPDAPAADGASVLAQAARWLQVRPLPPPAVRLRCNDASDQVFIDLAVAERAGWLFSRDRAVLRLRRRTAALGGPVICAPDGWAWPSGAAG